MYSITISGYPFSRSYGVILPSSLTRILSNTLGYSPRLPVSVYGTIYYIINARSYFSAALYTNFTAFLPRPAPRNIDKRICLLIFLHAFNRTSNTGLRFITASLHHLCNWFRNINLIPINYALRPRLRGRLTLRSLTLLRKPRACGVRVSIPHYRYLCRHSLLYLLQLTLRLTFFANTMLSYQDKKLPSEASVICLSPVHLRCIATRPVSYYALFQ